MSKHKGMNIVSWFFVVGRRFLQIFENNSRYGYSYVERQFKAGGTDTLPSRLLIGKGFLTWICIRGMLSSKDTHKERLWYFSRFRIFPSIRIWKRICTMVKCHFWPSKSGVEGYKGGNTGLRPVFPLSRLVKRGNRHGNGPEAPWKRLARRLNAQESPL